MSLLTAFKVQQLTSMDISFPTDVLNPILDLAEQFAFKNSHFGLTKYNALVTDKSPDNYAAWKDQAYTAGQRVIYKGEVQQAKINTSASPETSDWELVPLFQTPSNQELWDKGLGRWLALMVWYRSLKYGTYKSHSKGLTKTMEDAIETVSYKEYLEFKQGILADAQDQLELLIEVNECEAKQVKRGRRFFIP